MRRTLFIATCLVAASSAGLAQTPKLPIQSSEESTIYVNPNATSTENSIETKGATLGVQNKDGSGMYGGMDTSGRRPTYSLGASSGGDVSFSAGAESDGKDKKGLKAGITIKY
ncbi:conserved exported hypothetical protein [Burkholderiales bacterium 8X]|nr:conserved exported hypothetical protein [Burkholderiales bacterium 8X]